MRPTHSLLASLTSLVVFACGGGNDDSNPFSNGPTGGSGEGATSSGGQDASGGGGATDSGGRSTGGSRPTEAATENLFSTLTGKSQTEVDSKVSTAVDRFFGIGTGEPSTPTRDAGYRCYYELPQDRSMAFVWAADSNDIRSEGMSYGLMIAVQMDMQEQFDKLWKFAKAHSQYTDGSVPAWRYYFRWRGQLNTGSPNNWQISWADGDGPAPDGDEYYAAALYLADRRWGSSGTYDYRQEADNISAAMLHNQASADGRTPIINAGNDMVVFYPLGTSAQFTDPSYHLPAFYELFALYGPSSDASRWQTIADTSRGFLVSSAHRTTGLHPDYAQFSGAATNGGNTSASCSHDRFCYDAWRVVMNMAIDYALFSQDPRLQQQVEKYHAFFGSHLANGNVSNSLFALDGSGASGGGSTALTATLAAGALASTADNRATYVENLWAVPQQSGEYRYYQETVYLLGLLATAGKFRYDF